MSNHGRSSQHPSYQDYSYQDPSYQDPSYAGRSYGGPSYGGPSYGGPSSAGPSYQEEQPNWSKYISEWPLRLNKLKENSLNTLVGRYHHDDFKLSGAWLCIGQSNISGEVGTNHVFLKFDFEACGTHPWRGVKLEAKDDQEGKRMKNAPRDKVYHKANLLLSLKDWSGEPRGLKYCIELNPTTLFGGETLVTLIGLLKEGGLTSFGFTTIKNDKTAWYPVIVGCRDYM